MRVVKDWNRLPSNVVDAPCLAVFKLVSPEVIKQLDKIISEGTLQLNSSIPFSAVCFSVQLPSQ